MRFPALAIALLTLCSAAAGDVPATENTKSSDGAIKILFLGDSLTEGYGVPKEKAYPTLVVERLNNRFAHRKMAKRVAALYGGVSGSTSASALSRLRWFLKAKPSVLFLAMGANDGLRGLPPAEMEKNLDATIALARKEGLKIVLAGMRLPPNYGKKNSEEFAAVFTHLAKKYDLPFVPFLLATVGGEKDLNIEDGIHPNEKGHAKIAELIFPTLENVLTEGR
ncbi:MAG: arylesterase [Bdellovibrionales bacterium]|nr:arylesterase [Bdellovibrionales bacterium]